MKQFTDLGDFIKDIYQQLGCDDSFSDAISAEYSPKLQLKMLNIDDASNLQQPILDIGCGKQGNLVKYLNSLGIDAYGIDINASTDGKILNIDWFDLPCHSETWGTIISHLAFSIHFINHHFRKNGQPDRYAQSYMNFLHSLKKGGCLFYTPVLPFIEEYLPSPQFNVEIKPIKIESSDFPIKNPIIDMFYSARVEKRK
jgi:hypothetical protein